MAKIQVAVDLTVCTGHGRCYALAPELFDADDQAQAVVLTPTVDSQHLERARLAEANCPEHAVTVTELE
jgi:ferredoxin